jgi:hypothetical protein
MDQLWVNGIDHPATKIGTLCEACETVKFPVAAAPGASVKSPLFFNVKSSLF